MAVELQAAASLLQVPVYILLPTCNGMYQWVPYVPQDDSLLDFPLEPPLSRSLSSINHLELINVGACHYNCIANNELITNLAYLPWIDLNWTQVLPTTKKCCNYLLSPHFNLICFSFVTCFTQAQCIIYVSSTFRVNILTCVTPIASLQSCSALARLWPLYQC